MTEDLQPFIDKHRRDFGEDPTTANKEFVQNMKDDPRISEKYTVLVMANSGGDAYNPLTRNAYRLNLQIGRTLFGKPKMLAVAPLDVLVLEKGTTDTIATTPEFEPGSAHYRIVTAGVMHEGAGKRVSSRIYTPKAMETFMANEGRTAANYAALLTKKEPPELRDLL